jgi:hypothetical protein
MLLLLSAAGKVWCLLLSSLGLQQPGKYAPLCLHVHTVYLHTTADVQDTVTICSQQACVTCCADIVLSVITPHLR